MRDKEIYCQAKPFESMKDGKGNNNLDLRCLEGLGELVAELAPRVDGEDARDRNPHGAVRVHVLMRK